MPTLEYNGIFTKFQSRLPLLLISSSFYSSIPAIHKVYQKAPHAKKYVYIALLLFFSTHPKIVPEM